MKKPKTTQYVSHCTSSWVDGDSMARKERYAGRPQPTRFETGAARGLMVWRIAMRAMPREISSPRDQTINPQDATGIVCDLAAEKRDTQKACVARG